MSIVQLKKKKGKKRTHLGQADPDDHVVGHLAGRRLAGSEVGAGVSACLTGCRVGHLTEHQLRPTTTPLTLTAPFLLEENSIVIQLKLYRPDLGTGH